MTGRVEILGLDKVLKALKGLQPEIRKKAMAAGASAGAIVFKRGVISLAPEKTGALKRSIAIKRISKKLLISSGIIGSMVYVRTGGRRTKKQKSSGEDAFYWKYQEYGYMSGKKRSRKRQPGKFFIKRAFDKNKTSIEKAYKNRILKEIEKYRGN